MSPAIPIGQPSNKYEPSNLYASKIYSEHPIRMWSLDDALDYLDLIGDTKRSMDYSGSPDPYYDWIFTNITREGQYNPTIPNIPFSETLVNKLIGSNSGLQGICEGPLLFNLSDLDDSRGTFTIGLYYYSTSVYLDSIELGYRYFDGSTNIDVVETFTSGPLNSWIFISKTFQKPTMATYPEIRPIIKMSFTPSGGGSELYEVYTNGLTVGQWAEDTNTNSLGVRPLSDNVNINQACNAALYFGDLIECKPYGVVQPDGYGTSTLFAESGFYLTDSSKIFARNSGIPMVFGSNNVTQLLDPGVGPSIIFPAQGFLNEKGKYNQYCVEFWMRLQCDSLTPTKIFGPISSFDGLYVDSNFITLSIGGHKASHFISEWYRPMLVHINVINNGASLLINGEEVISLSFDTSSLEFPSEFINDPGNIFDGKSNNWVGFYAQEGVPSFEIDCVAIYSYPASVPVAKRRMIYGQGVASPDFINSSYNGTTSFIDYSFADYTSNYNYPDFAKWPQANFSNLSATYKSLSTPTYSLPQIFIEGTEKTVVDMYESNKNNQMSTDIYFSLKPNSTLLPDTSWDNINSYMYLSSLQSISGTVKSIYGIFEINPDLYSSEQILFYLENSINKQYIKVVIDGTSNIRYYFNEEELDSESLQQHGSLKFTAGINFDLLISKYGVKMSRFFSNRKNLSLYIGGNPELNKTFSGKIYRVSICNVENSSIFNLGFRNDGTAYAKDQVIVPPATVIIDDVVDFFESSLSTYTLLPIFEANNYYLDIGISGYWEDYSPLSYFGQFTSNLSNEELYTLNFLQVNFGYPKFSVINESQYNLNSPAVRAYVTFQDISSGANSLQNTFIYNVGVQENSVIDLDLYPNWKKTKFEIVDGTIIYPRSDIDFNNLAIVYRLEFNASQSINKPISIKKFQIASQSFKSDTFNTIGTRFGTKMYPYTRSGVYYDYDAKNPYKIYKGNTPYLYLTRDSGIELCGTFSSESERGINIPINTTEAGEYDVGAIQFFIRNDLETFPESDTKLFEIIYAGDTVSFYSSRVNSAGTRAKVYSKQKSTGLPLDGLAYYLNGKLVNELVMTSREWSAIGISFNPPISFAFTQGELNITSPFLFNNISYYQSTDLEKKQSSVGRRWIEVLNNGSENLEWGYWYFNAFTWEGMLISKTVNLFGSDPSAIYNTYIGTNRIIIDDNEGMIIDIDKMRLYSDARWSISVGTPV